MFKFKFWGRFYGTPGIGCTDQKIEFQQSKKYNLKSKNMQVWSQKPCTKNKYHLNRFIRTETPHLHVSVVYWPKQANKTTKDQQYKVGSGKVKKQDRMA